METNQLSMRWVPVTDTSGRTHVEAVWVTEASVASQASQVSQVPGSSQAA
jgi:hypothetical protein